MDINTIISFVAVATLLVISPGPNGFLIAKTVPTSGSKAALANIWGFVAAFYVHGSLSIFGISILLVQSAQAFMMFKLLGAFYLIWLGIKAIAAAVHHKTNVSSCHLPVNNEQPVSRRSAFLEGFLTNVLNPKVSMFYLAAFPQFLTAGDSPLNAYILVTAHSTVNFLWFLTMVVMLAKVRAVTTGGAFRRWLNSITGAVFIAFGAKLALLEKD